MVVTVPVVRVMKMAVDEIADMVSMRHGRVTTVGAVYVIWSVAAAIVPLRARVGVFAVYRNLMLIHVVAMGVMEMAIMQVIDVAIMLNGNMTATRSVYVSVVGVNLTIAHTKCPVPTNAPALVC